MMGKYQITVNGQPREVEADDDKPLLWVLREDFGLTGTKFGCGAGLCGACTVHLDGQPVRSCSLPVSSLSGKQVLTIEGLDKDGKHPLQLAWAELSVPQCGYCQSGQIMSAAALLAKTPQPKMSKSIRPWPATFVAVVATLAFARPSTRPPKAKKNAPQR